MDGPASATDDVGGGLRFRGLGSAVGLFEAGLSRLREVGAIGAGGGIVLKEVLVRGSIGREGGGGS